MAERLSNPEEQAGNVPATVEIPAEVPSVPPQEAAHEIPAPENTPAPAHTEVSDQERERAMAEIRNSIPATPAPNPAQNASAPAASTERGRAATAPVAAPHGASGVGGKGANGLVKGLKFIGKMLKFGFMLTVAAGASLLEKFSKMKLGKKGGGGGHGGGGGGHAKAHAPAKSHGGGGHSAPAKSHGGGGHH